MLLLLWYIPDNFTYRFSLSTQNIQQDLLPVISSYNPVANRIDIDVVNIEETPNVQAGYYFVKSLQGNGYA